jgi:hypothetical protein
MFAHLDVTAAVDFEPAVRGEIIDLCESAYCEDFSRLFQELEESVHVLARDEHGLLVSHTAWVTRWLQPADHPVLRTAYVEAVATIPTRQRQGLATTVLHRIDHALRSDPIAVFFGIIVRMFYREHEPAHFHAEHQGQHGKVDFDGQMIVGSIASKTALKLIRDWARLHRAELEANWARMKAGQALDRIAPLE